MLKIKLEKSHRKESDWNIIKEIFTNRNVLTFIPAKRRKRILCMDVVEIADQHNVDVLIDAVGGINSKCFLYAHEEKKLKAVILCGYGK